VGYGDGTVALLNLDGEQDSVPEVRRRNGAISAVAFSPDGKKFAAGGEDGFLTVWETGRLKLVGSMEPGSEAVSVVFSPEGEKVASGGVNGVVNFWTVLPRSAP
jgi:WD40 repeat protein